MENEKPGWRVKYRWVIIALLLFLLARNIYFDYGNPVWVWIDGVAIVGATAAWIFKNR